MLDKNHKIKVAPRNMNVDDENLNIPKQNLGALISILNKIKTPIDYEKDAEVESVEINKTNIKVSLNKDLQIKIPILIKQSYFPSWQRADGQVLYLASPTFMLTFAEKDFELNFEKDISVTVGNIVSLLTILFCLGLLFRDRRKIFKSSNL
jgi:hypothetical protein